MSQFSWTEFDAERVKSNIFNPIETQELFNRLNMRLSYLPKGLDNSGTILWHFRLSNPLANKEFRDEYKNLWKIKPWDILVSIEAGVNQAGVGDGKEPTHAITYSIKYSIQGSVRGYRCKGFHDAEYIHKYVYSRDMEDSISRFITHLQINVPGYIDHKFIIN